MNTGPQTTTFLFTDLENSTPLWENHPGVMQALSTRHDALLRDAIESHRGRVVKSTGDGFHAAFEAATDAVAAALEGQLAILQEKWPVETGPLQVRMGLHTGESREREGDYYGSEVNRAARVMGLAYGGQILVSEATASLIRKNLPPQVWLTDLGEHRLKGLAGNERIFQLCHPDLPAEFPPLKSLSAYKHNLPVQLSSFVGRAKEMDAAKQLLHDTHLLTLLGPGGTGKTRLMLEVAEEVIDDYSDGVWLVELAPLTDPSLVAERVAAALDVQEQPGRMMLDSLVDYLRQKELLLLLDNVEHLVEACAALAEALLTRCPELRIMVTGREALFIEGEITQQIASLSLPGGNGKASFEEISSSESVQLFVTRAQEITPDMALSQATAPVIAEIVRHLDGIPLAIELAAARTRMLSFEQIADRLNDRFRLLTGGRRTALPRQRTLLAMIDWSWNLLEEKEQLLWRRLSIFSGGWSLEAAQSVASDESLDEYDIFDNLEQLVNKSLVTVRYPAGGAARYDMLESIRQYGHDRLLESGEMEALRDRHVDYFVAFADEAAPHLAQASAPWTKRINLELDNLRAALIWSLEDRPELALRIGGDLFYREAYSLSPREARSWLEPAIAKTRGMLGEEVTTIRAEDFIRALLGLAVANGIQGNTGAAVSLAEEGIQLARKFGELRYVAYATSVKYLQHPFNLPPEAMQELEEAVSISRENGYEAELGLSLVVYGIALDAQGKAEMAMAYLQEALSISRRVNSRLDAGIFGVQARLAVSLGDSDSAKSTIEAALDDYKAMNHRRGIVMGQSSLAHIYREEGNLDEAESYYRQSIVGWQELGHRPAVAHQIECLAYIAIGRGQHEHAARLLGAAGRARRELNSLSEDPQEIRDLALAMEQLGDALGEKERDLAMAEGAKMSLDDAVTVALKEVA